MKFLILLGVCYAKINSAVGGVEDVQALQRYSWEKYKDDYKDTYLTSDGNRRDIFNQNLASIIEHNKRAQDNVVNYTRCVNKFTGMTDNEVQKYRNGYILTSLEKTGIPYESFDKNDDLSSYDYNENEETFNSPASFDWRTKGVVTEVKDQGSCSSCWAFCALGAVESAFALKTGKLVCLSEQELVDCSKPLGNDGCTGGNAFNSFDYVKQKRIATQEDYPYEDRNGTCRLVRKYTGAKINDYVDIAEGDENQMKHALAKYGPISVAMDGSHRSFYSYSDGIYYEPKCSKTKLDHGVVLVGYGSENGKDYWIAKNCWGTDWGINGYILLSRNRDNNCGIATMAVYPVAS